MTDQPTGSGDGNGDRYAWERPGAHEVAPGVYRIPLPLPDKGLRAVNAYAVLDGDGLVLIDAGWDLPEARELLARSLDELDAKLGDVDRHLVTHVHRDHYTQAVALRREFGTPVALGAEERHTLDVLLGPEWGGPTAELRLLHRAGAYAVADELRAQDRKSTESGKSRPSPALHFAYPDEWLAHGTDLGLRTRRIRAIATPGHTRGHLVFHDEDNGLLFAGDHVLPQITPSIGVEPAPTELPLRDYLGSLKAVRALPDARLLPAHGPDTDSVHRRIDELLDHHRTRLDDILEALAAHRTTTAADTAARLTWTRHRRALGELDLFSRMLAILETAAHLDLLVLEGRLRVATESGTRHYTVA
ncbi:MBL fold metallo-hydrolase [Phaeacidiphilus oryzae]|uniref:MBL fold metallo-hydrolase n=1 Tax=Phaeacidiphilus oryzae TaxID=348818 RepID=UPI00056D7A4D|nr:MBL fold metallo-hydrolase [Phaeacidiphilus oryzae]